MSAQAVRLTELLRTGRAPSVIDQYGRAFTYLRISVTDLCNLRCVYCMPEDGIAWLPREEILSFEEIETVVIAAAACGVSKIRLTGGEPLVRKDIARLIGMLSKIRGITDLALTTNGVLLADQAQELSVAGLKRVNVSLDTLNPDRFRRIARRGDLANVLEGIRAAVSAGLHPLKLNMVVLRGVNDDEVEAFAELTLKWNVQVRFIEVMPLGEGRDCTTRTGDFDFVSGQEVQERIERRFGALTPLSVGKDMSDPARVWTLNGAPGTLGFISAMSSAFCERCNRLRLTADGKLRSCLLNGGEVDVRGILRKPHTATEKRNSIMHAFRTAAEMKPEFHAAWDSVASGAMSRIGG